MRFHDFREVLTYCLRTDFVLTQDLLGKLDKGKKNDGEKHWPKGSSQKCRPWHSLLILEGKLNPRYTGDLLKEKRNTIYSGFFLNIFSSYSTSMCVEGRKQMYLILISERHSSHEFSLKDIHEECILNDTLQVTANIPWVYL